MALPDNVLSTSTLAGDRVRNRQGEDLGTIEDFMLDMQTGKVAYAVLSFGGVLGVGTKLFAVPPEALELDEEESGFVLDVDKETLKDAPGFDKDDWPDLADPALRTEIYSYYGRAPH